MQSFRIQLQKKLVLELNSTRNERDGISAIKFEAARLHFLSDLFVAVAVVSRLSSLLLLKQPVFLTSCIDKRWVFPAFYLNSSSLLLL